MRATACAKCSTIILGGTYCDRCRPAKPRVRERIRKAIATRDQYKCGICGQPINPVELHIDHIIPRIHGGTNQPANLQATHRACNLTKGAGI